MTTKRKLHRKYSLPNSIPGSLFSRGFPTRILEVELEGVTEAIGNLTERGAVDPVVKATLMLSESGFVSVSEAVAFGEIKDESITGKFPLSHSVHITENSVGKLKGFFGSGSSSPESEGTSAETVLQSDAPPETPEVVEEKPPVPDTIPLKLSTYFTTIPPMTVEEKKKARNRYGQRTFESNDDLVDLSLQATSP